MEQSGETWSPVFAIATGFFLLLTVPQPLSAATITWNAPATITADTDIKTLGGLVYAYDESNTSTTVNGVTFAAGNSNSILGSGNITMSGFTGLNNSTFSNPTGLSSAYAILARGAAYGNTAAATINLNNLAVNHIYLPQVWVNDSRNGTSRTETVTGGGNTVTLNYNTTGLGGGAGQYTIGSFTASAATQAFTLTGNASTQLNAIQLRDVTGVWSGAASGNLDNGSGNFTGGNSFSTISGFASPVTALYFADTDGLSNAVANSGLTVQTGGLSTGSLNFQNSSVSYTLTSSDANGIKGTTAVNVAGAGTVTFLGTHAYTGATTVQSGNTLNIGNGATSGSISGSAINNAGTLNFNSNSAVSHAAVISGAGSLTKKGTGTLTLSVNNTMTGAVTLDGGTLKYTADQTTAIGALTFGATGGSANLSTLDLSSTPSNLTASSLTVQTLSASANNINIGAGKTLTINGNVNIFNSAATTLGTSVTFNSAGSVPTSTYAVTGANSFIFANSSSTASTTRTNTLDMRNLGAFNAGSSGTALTSFIFGRYNYATDYTAWGVNKMYLAPSSTIYATAFAVADDTANSGVSENTLYLGSGANQIHATTIIVGESQSQGTGTTVTWDAGVTTGSLSFAGTGATAAVSNMYVGRRNDTGSNGDRVGVVDLTNGTVTGTIANLYVGIQDGGGNPGGTPIARGTFKLGGGTGGSSNLTVDNLYIGYAADTNGDTSSGTVQIDGGNLTISNNIEMTHNSAPAAALNIFGGTLAVGGNITSLGGTGTITLNGGTLDMTSGNIGSASNPISTLAYASGTLSNPGSIYAGAANVTTVTSDNKTISLTSPNTFSVTGTGGFTLGADTGATSTHKLTLTGTGSFSVNNASANVVIGIAQGADTRTNTSTLDLTSLASVTLGDATTAINELRVGYGQTATASLLLSNTSNTINANVVSIANSNGANSSGTPSITLGTGTNVIATDTIHIGLSKGRGTLKFASQTAGSPGTLTITDQAGTGGANIVIGSNNGVNTGFTTTGLLDLRGHTATVTAGTVTVGNSTNTSNSPQGTLSFDAGTFTATTLNMATLAAASGAFDVTGTLNIGGGNFTVGTLGVANKSAAGTGTANGSINVSNGNLTVNTSFTLATQATAGASAGTLTITGGTVTSNADIVDGGGAATSTITLNGGTLDLTGHNLGSVASPIDAFNFTSGTLVDVGTAYGPVTLASGTHTFNQNGYAGEIKGAIGGGAFGITKTGAQTLTLSGSNTYTGTTAISAGTLSIATTGALPGWDTNSKYAVASGATLAVYNAVTDGNVATMLGTTNFAAGSAIGFDTTSGDRTYGVNLVNTAQGSLGLTKIGVNTLTLTGANTYTGATKIISGTLQIGNAGTTGTLGTGVVANSGTLVFNRTNTYTLASGNLVTGAGAVTLANTGTVASSVDNQFNTTGALNFGASNGATLVSTLDLTSGGSTFGSLNVLTNSGSANTITIGAGKTLNVKGAVSIGASSGTTNLTLTGATGTLAVNNGGGATNDNLYIGGGGTATGTVNMSGLGTFTANLGTGTLALGNGSTTNNGSIPFTAILAANNTLTATKVSVGAGFGNTTNASAYTMRLGSGANTINTADLYIGVYNNQGRGNAGTTLNFNTTTGTLTLRGLSGGSTRANVHIGENQGGSTGTGSGGSFDLGGSASTGLSGGNADLLIDALTISRRTAGSNDASSMTFRGGNMDVNTLVMGNFTGTTGNSATGTLTLNGGTVVFNTGVTLGWNTSGTGTGSATLNVSGATVTATPGILMGNQTLGTVNSTINVTGGSLTLGSHITTVGATNTTLTLGGGTLDMGGFNIGTALASIDAFTINPATSATLKNVGSINGTAGITKTGAGTLTLNANSYAGSTAINAGTVQIDSADDLGNSSATNTISLNTGTLRSTANSYDLGVNRDITLAGAGTIQSDAGTLTVSGDVSNGANMLTLVGDGNIVITGVIGTGATPTGGLNIGYNNTMDGNVTLGGNNLFTGDVTLVDTNTNGFNPNLTLTHSGALGVGPKTVTSTGGGEIHLQNNITLASNISFTTSGFALFNDSGNNTANGNISMSSGNGNTLLTSSSGLLTLNGNISAIATSRNLELRGDGDGVINGVISNGTTASLQILKSQGTGTWTLTGNNTNTGATTISAGTLRVGAASGVATSGTLVNSSSINNNASLIFRRTDTTAQDLAGAISGTGSVTYESSGTSDQGTFDVNNASSYNGGTTISNARINLTNATGLGSGGVQINSGGQVFINSAITVSNNLTLNGNGWTESAGQLGALRMADGSSLSGNITLGSNSRLVVNRDKTGAISGNISGGFAVEIGEDTHPGTLALSGSNGYSGETKLSYGILRLDSANALPGGIALSGGTSSLNFNGGVLGLNNGNFSRATGTGVAQVKWTTSGGFAAFTTDRTVNLGGAGATATWNSGSFVPTGSALILGGSGAAGTLIFENPIDLGAATRAVQADDGTASVDGRLTGILSGTGGLSKSGAGTLELTADNSFTGTFGVTAGTLRLAGAAGSANNASGAAVSGGGTLLLDNTTNLGDRLKDSGTVSLAGGTLSFYHPAAASTNYSETTGALAVTGTSNVVRTYRAAPGQTSTLTFASLAYTPGTLQFYGEGLGLSDGRNQIFIGGSVPLTGGIIGGNASYFDGTTTGSAGYSLANGVVLYAPASNINVRGGIIPDNNSTIGIVEAGASGSITLSSPIVTIQSLTQNASSAGAVDLQGRTLRVGSVTIGNTNASLTLGSAPGDGILMAWTNGGSLSLNNNYATPMTVNAVIADNGSASSLIKTGAATVQIAGAATYTGATDISTGTLALIGGGALSDSTAVQLSGASTILDLSAISAGGETIGSLAGVVGSSVVLGGKDLTTAGPNNTVFAGVISGVGSSFTKLGGGLLTLSGDNLFTGSVTAGGGTLELTGNNEFAGTVSIGTGAILKVPVILQSGVQPLGLGTSPLVFGGNVDFGSRLEYSGSTSAILDRGIHMASGQGGTVDVSQATGTLILNGELSGSSDFHKAGAGTMIMPGEESWSGNGAVLGGTLILGGAIFPGVNSLSAGNWSISAGATLRINTSGSFETPTLTRNGTFSLESGTLRTNAIAGSGTFQWGNATLTTLGNLTEGSVDRTDPAGAPSGPVLLEGNILDFNGNLTTAGTTGRGSILDLGGLTQNNGLRYNEIKITGTLNLAGVDSLVFNINPYLLRPTSPNSVTTGDWGTMRLVMADSITGTFDSISGIGSDSIGWRLLGSEIGDPAFTGAANLPMNTFYFEYASSGITGEGIQAGAALLLHYKVAGSVPEPGSLGLTVAGVILARALTRRKT